MLKRLLALAAVIGTLLYVGLVHTSALITFLKDLTGDDPDETDSGEDNND